ncbi:MAG: hypothetical protein F6K39_38270 [Okeania sp. SIO3B3]|nr:hypothetical protein [Okeania sp. SIO3B3]
MNTYTLEKGRQKAEGSYAEGKKRLKGIKFFITDPSEHDITPTSWLITISPV